MKITATHDVYTYDELSPVAQSKALENLQNSAWELLDSGLVSEDIAGYFIYLATGNDTGALTTKQLADEYGVRIYWQVSYVQSDHAAIEGKLNRSDLPNLAWPDTVNYARITTTNYGYSRVELIETETETWIEHGELYDATQNMVNELNHRLYRYARQTCEGYTDRDYVLNEYRDFGSTRQFNDDGSYAPVKFWSEK